MKKKSSKGSKLPKKPVKPVKPKIFFKVFNLKDEIGKPTVYLTGPYAHALYYTKSETPITYKAHGREVRWEDYLLMCHRGYHMTTLKHLWQWVTGQNVIWQVEPLGKRKWNRQRTKLVAQSFRFIRKLRKAEVTKIFNETYKL